MIEILFKADTMHAEILICPLVDFGHKMFETPPLK